MTYPRVARQYSVHSLLHVHIEYLVYGSEFPLELEYLLRSDHFGSLEELVPGFLDWHKKTQKYEILTIGEDRLVERRFEPSRVVQLLEFCKVDPVGLLELVSFVGNTRLSQVSFSGGFVMSRKGRLSTTLARESYAGLVKKLDRCVLIV
ncbi:hypothetical protein [Blackberry virus A]|uniref:Uncharacterized protein n=1 Tax=Blackberry virus A TaxID=2185086 RepID=A0A2S1YE91_9VIRU|nr:hypothetical protein [Blackberry virus A]AWK02340.1 hypothetical protein [Blackberry virus A]